MSLQEVMQSATSTEVMGLFKNEADTLNQTPEGLWGDDGNPHMPVDTQVMEVGQPVRPTQQ